MNGRKCPDCQVSPGEVHQYGCDVERCPLCGGQTISCGCIYECNGMARDRLDVEHPDIYVSGPTLEMEETIDREIAKYGGRLPWTGEFPGRAEAAAFGWFAVFKEGRGWVRCDAGDEGATPDLNRLYASATWDKTARTWKLR